ENPMKHALVVATAPDRRITSATSRKETTRTSYATIAAVAALAHLVACRASVSRPPRWSPGGGIQYCADLATKAEKEASTWSVLGWSVGVLGAGAVIAGPAMGPDPRDDARWLSRNRNVLVSAGGAVLIATARMLLGASDVAAKTSADATSEL